MDIRCKTCSKLFRIADEKIAGKGIRFKCSQCGETITVLKEEAERERFPQEIPAPSLHEVHPSPVMPAASPAAPVPSPEPTVTEAPMRLETEEQEARDHQPPAPSGLDDFDFSEPHAAAADAGRKEWSSGGDIFSDLRLQNEQGKEQGISVPDEEERVAEKAFAFPADIISEPKHKAVFDVSPSRQAEEPFGGAVVPAGPASEQMPTIEQEEAPAPAASSVGTEWTPPATATVGEEDLLDLGAALAIPKGRESSVTEPLEAGAEEIPVPDDTTPRGSGTKALILIIAVIVLAAVAALYFLGFPAGTGEQTAPRMPEQRLRGAGQEISAQGLVIDDPLAYIDPSQGDLVITGKVRNTLDRAIPGWYLVVDVTDGSRKEVATVRIMNGVQLFTKHDLDILARRGTDVAGIKESMLRSVKSASVPANGMIEFEAVLLEPPAGIAGFLPTLRTFDSEFVIKGMAMEGGR